jgi:nitroimidazol reductase NimA-like FMN-containing flavoprotein (pyridoxamine 5'-phosphate oxidase superfamily)
MVSAGGRHREIGATMSEHDGEEQLTTVRRRDRAVTDEAWIRSFLHEEPFGSLATVREGQPFILGNLFLYDEERHAIYLHTARRGRTRSNVETDDRACFSVGRMGRLLPADEAREFSVEYASVVVFGRIGVVEDDAEALDRLQGLMDKYSPHLRPGRDYRPAEADHLRFTSVYRLDIESWSAKRNRAPDEFPGAHRYGEEPPADREPSRAPGGGSRR